jgi:hypothetical protein
MKILDHKSAINRRQYQGLTIVETAIYRVSCLNRILHSKSVAGYKVGNEEVSNERH